MNAEAAIAAGTRLLTPAELAPRLGLGGTKGARKVIARVKAGRLPAYRPNARTYLFHWPSVLAATFDHRKTTTAKTHV